MWFKKCPRCEGDLYLRDQIDSFEVVCLQCSRIVRRQNKFMSRLQKVRRESKAKARAA